MHKLVVTTSVLFILIFISSMNVYAGSIPFITTWKVDNEEDYYGIEGNNEVVIPVSGTGYDYTVDWGDGTITTNITGEGIHEYATPGIYTVSITGDFPRMNFSYEGRLLTIEQWGNNIWTTMESAFLGCYSLQGNATDAPDLTNVKSTASMFYGAKTFNQNINDWNVSNVTNMNSMFYGALSFNQNIENWNVDNVTNMEAMFEKAYQFNQNIGNWNVSNVTNMEAMFESAESFNQNIKDWNVGNVTTMKNMFAAAYEFNQDIGNWNVSNVTNMKAMLYSARSFNQDIGNWNVSKVTSMREMFYIAPVFNQDISDWDVSHVTDMTDMFSHAKAFNQDISSWDVGNTTKMASMFYNAKSFNQDISTWNVSKVIYMRLMFGGAISFDQNLGSWNVVNVIDMDGMFSNGKLSLENYDALLLAWSGLNLQSNVDFHGGDSQYCFASTARNQIIENFNWIIKDKGSAGSEINHIENQEGIDTYTLPTITGTALSGNQKYYTGPNATGTDYSAGDHINFYDYSSYPITLYAYDSFNDTCNSELSFELTITPSLLACTSLTNPIPDSIEVLINTNLEWNSVTGAEGYILSIGTANSNTNILKPTDIGNVLSYELPRYLPGDTQIYVKITPYNDTLKNTDCLEGSFRTGAGTPPFFTPNGDDFNDTWIVPDPSNTISTILIYDRYGKLLKQLTDLSKGWDGMYLNNPLPASDYWFLIRYKNDVVSKGNFSLIR